MKYPLWTSKEAVNLDVEFQLVLVDGENWEIDYMPTFRLTPKQIRLLLQHCKDIGYGD